MTRSFGICILLLLGSALAWAQPQPLTRWTRTLVGDSIDTATGIVQASDGGYMVCGYTASWGEGGWDIYVAKLDSLGNSPWYRTYGTAYHDAAMAIRRTSDNMYILAGYAQTRTDGPLNVYLMKINSIGIMQWDFTYTGTAEEYANDVQQTFDGGYILAGSTDGGGPHTNVYLRKTDSHGNPQWTRVINHNDDEGFSVQQTADSGYIIAGRTTNFQGDGWLIKTDGTGHTTWNRYIGQAGDEVFRCVRQTPDGGYIIAGTSNSSSGDDRPYLVKTDSSGTVRWYHVYGPTLTSGAFYSVEVLPGGNYIAAGSLDRRMYIVRTDSAGTVRWDEEYGNGSADAIAYAMQPTRDASYVMAGYTVSSTTGWDIYAMKTGRDRLTPNAADPQLAPLPSGYALSAYPNPFNPATTLSFVLPHREHARIEIHDVTGRQVDVLADRVYEQGEHRIYFNAAALPSGIYFARLTTPSFAATQKMLLLK
jgi:hypothetical protein